MRITGTVIRGKKEGRKIGFPTANLILLPSQKKPRVKEGIYAGAVSVNREQKIYRAGIVITCDEKRRTMIEAYLIGFSGNLYEKQLKISLKHYLRPFKKFNTKTLLKKQIEKDIKQIEKLSVN